MQIIHGHERQFSGRPDGDCHASTEVVSPLTSSQWNNSLRNFPSATIFDTLQWAEVLHKTYAYKPHYLHRVNSPASALLMPVMEVDSWLVGRRGISLPFTDECSVLHSGPHIPTNLLREVRAIPASRRWSSWEYRGGAVQIPGAPVAQSYFGHQLEIFPDHEAQFARFDGNVRTSLRKALKNQIVPVTTSGIDAMQAFHRQLSETRKRHGLPPQPFRFFAEIERRLVAAGMGFVVLAMYRGTPVASAVFLHLGEKAVYKFAASDSRFRLLQANHLVLWHGIQECMRRGCRVLDFGRTSRANAGLRHFKLAWRPTERSIDYVKYDLRRDQYVEGQRDLSTGWHNRLFRLLPTPISKAIGAMVYRHFA